MEPWPAIQENLKRTYLLLKEGCQRRSAHHANSTICSNSNITFRTKWIGSDELFTDIEKNPQSYCPWMIVALYLLSESDKEMVEKHRKIFDKWQKTEYKNKLEKPLQYHFPTNNWRRVN
jgi:hypothetical protein